jgi:hypothetical protein
MQQTSRRLHRPKWFPVVLMLAVLGFAGLRSAIADEHDRVILKFDTMIGDPGSSSSLDVIRGFTGAGAPWAILRSARGELRADGRLDIRVRGLVIPGDGDDNPVAQFRAALSCQDPSDANNSQLFFTNLFPATTGVDAGDSDIQGQVKLPQTCFAPLVFIVSPPSASNPNGVWFAVTGFSPASLVSPDSDQGDR